MERTVYKIEGRTCVQYLNNYHPLHSAGEFNQLKRLSIESDLMLFSNELQVSDYHNNLDRLELAPFIYEDEMFTPQFK